MNLKQALKQFREAQEAISPVVATLLLVLVAAGAAIGFGVFMGAFQDDAQKKVGTDVGGDALTIGGSSTVFPLSQAGIALYQAQHPGTNFELTQGGSTLGVKGVGTCALDVGASSKAVSTEFLNQYPDCDGKPGKDIGQSLVQHGLGYDLVVPITSPNACMKDFALIRSEVNFIYAANGGFAGTMPTAPSRGTVPVAINGAGGTVTWAELEAYLAATGATDRSGTGDCSAITSAIVVYDRADKGGTSEVFCETYISTSGICDSEKQITKTTLPNIQERDGNQLVEAAVKTDTLSLGFSSVGTSQKSGLEIIGFDQTDEAYALGMADNDKVDCPTDSSASELDYHGLARAACHDGFRALYYVTVGEATGAAKAFIDFMRTPDVNLKLTEQIGYVSLY